MENTMENKEDHTETTPDPTVELSMLRAELAAVKSAYAQSQQQWSQERETILTDAIVEREATKAGAFDPKAIRQFISGEVKREDDRVFVNDSELSVHFRKMKESDGWNLFQDSFAAYKDTNGKPADPPDRRKLSMEQYVEIRKTNPESLGLRKKK
jgi:hypothetical protein